MRRDWRHERSGKARRRVGEMGAKHVTTCSRKGWSPQQKSDDDQKFGWTHGENTEFTHVERDVSKERDRVFVDDIKRAVMVEWRFVSNVGYNIRKTTAAYTREEYKALMGTNLEASFDIVRVAYKKGVIGKGTSVIFNSSVAGLTSIQTGALYAMSKAALNQLTKSLACEWGKEGIRVNAIAPWYINTDLAQQVLKNEEYKRSVVRRTPMGRVGEPREVAAATVFLASQASSYVTGQILAIDGGFSVFGYAPPDNQLNENFVSGAFEETKKNTKRSKRAKQAKTAYLYFAEKERIKLTQQSPDMKPPEIMTTLGARWHALSEKNRKTYDKMAEKDTLRFDVEMKAYQPPEGYDKDGYGFVDDDFYQDGRKKRAKKEVGEPKNPKSAYIYFCEASRATIAPKAQPGGGYETVRPKTAKAHRRGPKTVQADQEKDKLRYGEK